MQVPQFQKGGGTEVGRPTENLELHMGETTSLTLGYYPFKFYSLLEKAETPEKSEAKKRKKKKKNAKPYFDLAENHRMLISFFCSCSIHLVLKIKYDRHPKGLAAAWCYHCNPCCHLLQLFHRYLQIASLPR